MAKNNNATVTLMAGGDIGPVYEPTEQFAELIAPVLQQADLRLAQCERVYSEHGGVEPQFVYGPGGNHGRQHPRMAGIWIASNRPLSLRSTSTLLPGRNPTRSRSAGRNDGEYALML